MKIIEFAFRLGVIFAIFAFLWGTFQLIFNLFRAGRKKNLIEEYSFKFVQYFFLVDVTFLFCLNKQDDSQLLFNEIVISAFVLLLYFIGKLQNRQQRINIFQISGTKIPNFAPLFNLKAEIAAIIFGIGVFGFFFFYPTFAKNPISSWFYLSILDIESTPVFGFIFKVIGFFVLLGILIKILNGFLFIFSGKSMSSFNKNNDSDSEKKDKFDDFEEIN